MKKIITNSKRASDLRGAVVRQHLIKSGISNELHKAHPLAISLRDEKPLAKMGKKLLDMANKGKGWDPDWVRVELSRALGGDRKKIDMALSFLSNFANVYSRRYADAGQKEYMEPLDSMINYVAVEPPEDMLGGKRPYCSYVLTLEGDLGLVNGAAGDVNLARRSAGMKEREGGNLFINYIGYLCPAKSADEKELSERLHSESIRHVNGLGLQCSYGIKEVTGADDFEAGFFDLNRAGVAPGLRIAEAIYYYYREMRIKPPEKQEPLLLLIEPLKNAGRSSIPCRIPYEDLKDIVLWEYVYRGLERIKSNDGKNALEVYMDYALKDVKTVDIDGRAYVELVRLE